jgi:hypothetical protein
MFIYWYWFQKGKYRQNRLVTNANDTMTAFTINSISALHSFMAKWGYNQGAESCSLVTERSMSTVKHGQLQSVLAHSRLWRTGSSWPWRRPDGGLYFLNIMMNLEFHKDEKYPNRLSNCRYCEVILKLFIRPWKITISLGVHASRKNQWEWRNYARRRIFLVEVQIFVFLVSKWNVESLYRNNICLWMHTLQSKRSLNIASKTDLTLPQ